MTAHDESPDGPPVSFIDNPLAPDVYADAVTGYFVRNGVITITFEAGRVNHVTSPGPLNRVVVGRLVVPLSAAQDLAIGLFDFLAQRGLAPPLPGPKDSN